MGLVPLIKAVHIAALSIWCAGLVALPLMLARHEHAVTQADFTRVRRFTHLLYTVGVTPAAVITVISGTWLIFLREVFVPWLFLKLAFVALLVGAHAWIGHILVSVAETKGTHTPPNPFGPMTLILVPALAILVLVLAKPEILIAFPDWLTNPQERQFPLDVPSR
nr:CopD family protein [Acuticoccus kalidii]